MTKFRVYKETQETKAPEAEVFFRLFEEADGVVLYACDKHGTKLSFGSLLHLDGRGIALHEAFGDFGIAREAYGRVAVRPIR